MEHTWNLSLRSTSTRRANPVIGAIQDRVGEGQGRSGVLVVQRQVWGSEGRSHSKIVSVSAQRRLQDARQRACYCRGWISPLVRTRRLNLPEGRLLPVRLAICRHRAAHFALVMARWLGLARRVVLLRAVHAARCDRQECGGAASPMTRTHPSDRGCVRCGVVIELLRAVSSSSPILGAHGWPPRSLENRVPKVGSRKTHRGR